MTGSIWRVTRPNRVGVCSRRKGCRGEKFAGIIPSRSRMRGPSSSKKACAVNSERIQHWPSCAACHPSLDPRVHVAMVALPASKIEAKHDSGIREKFDQPNPANPPIDKRAPQTKRCKSKRCHAIASPFQQEHLPVCKTAGAQCARPRWDRLSQRPRREK